MSGIVIIGAGECGVRAAFSLRELGFDGSIILLEAEETQPYERPPLSKEIDSRPKLIRDSEAYQEAQIELRLGTSVGSINVGEKRLVIDDQTILDYTKLLLATGAHPRLFPEMENCLTLRTAADARKISPHFTEGARIAFVGGGFIGLELAAIAGKAGAEVTVFEAAPRILGRAVPGEIASVVHARHEKEGVKIITNAQVRSADATRVTLSGGTNLNFDVVIAGVGAVPNTTLAGATGLTVDNGIVVDTAFRTSDPSIFAAGDCCNFKWRGERVRLESWKVAQDQGAHAAAAMLGNDDPYDKVPYFWSDQYDLTLQVVGLFDMAAPVRRRESDDGTTIVFQCDAQGNLAAVAGIGPGNAVAKDIRILEKLIERKVSVEPDVLSDPSQNLKQLLKAA